jgi:hypothetical protein
VSLSTLFSSLSLFFSPSRDIHRGGGKHTSIITPQHHYLQKGKRDCIIAAIDTSTMPDSVTSEVSAALELLQIKHHQPSGVDFHETGELLKSIFEHMDAESLRHWLFFLATPGSGHRPNATTLLSAGNDVDASHQSSGGILQLPFAIADAHDERYLSPLQCYIRKTCLEYFAATVTNATNKGRQTMVSEGRVGVRCSFCKLTPRDQQAAQASEFTRIFLCSISCISCSHFESFLPCNLPSYAPASFPNQIASIYSSVVMLQCRHFPYCREMPDSVREHLEALRRAGNVTPNPCGTKRRDFWSDSARSMGFIDTDAGVQFVPRVVENIPSDTSFHSEDVVSPSTNDIEVFPESNQVELTTRLNFVSPFEPIASSSDPITFIEDRDLVPDYVFLALAQLVPCQLITDDRIGAYRTRPIGFTGMCCRYCQGCQPGPGFGKFFPNSARSLAQTTTTQTVIKHITSKCKHVPTSVKVRFRCFVILRNTVLPILI